MRRSWSRIFAITLGLVLVMSILAACGSGTTSSGGNTPTTGSTTIKIGSDLPVSGKDETSGKPAENGAALAIQEANARDRKSTRLNSSHGYISYAVFCFKK